MSGFLIGTISAGLCLLFIIVQCTRGYRYNQRQKRRNLLQQNATLINGQRVVEEDDFDTVSISQFDQEIVAPLNDMNEHQMKQGEGINFSSLQNRRMSSIPGPLAVEAIGEKEGEIRDRGDGSMIQIDLERHRSKKEEMDSMIMIEKENSKIL